MQDLWFNKAGKTSRAEQRILKRANSTKPIDPRSGQVAHGLEVVVTAPIPQSERYKKEAAAAKDCLSQYNVPSCLEKHIMDGWNWKIGGMKGKAPQANECAENAIRRTPKKDKQITTNKYASMRGRVIPNDRNQINNVGIPVEQTMEISPIHHKPLEKHTCDSAFKLLKDQYIKNNVDELGITDCLELCMQNKLHEGDTLRMIREMESSPRYEREIQEYGKERTDIKIANRKAMLCASKKLTAYLCKNHKKEDTINQYLPYILGGLVLYILLKK